MTQIISVSDFNKKAMQNMTKLNDNQTQYACACGCKSFKLIQDKNNIKAQCWKCDDVRIIAWNDEGKILSLDKLKWKRPKLTLTMEEL